MKSSKAILFDIDDTLYDSTRASTFARRNAIEAMIDAGMPVGKPRAEAELQKVIAEIGGNHAHHFDHLLDNLGLEPNARLIAAGVVAYHNTKLACLHPFEETIPTLLKLRGIGCKLGVITNGRSVKQWEKLIRLGLQHFFDTVAVSQDVGVEKPEPVIFETCCRELQIEPPGCTFVGNDPEQDIAGAAGVGMRTVWMRQGKYRDTPPDPHGPRADCEIDNLRELLALVDDGRL